MKFSSFVRERDTFDDVENDLVFVSGMNFTYEKDGDYSPQIMQFLNYVLSLPDSEEVIYAKEEPERK